MNVELRTLVKKTFTYLPLDMVRRVLEGKVHICFGTS